MFGLYPVNNDALANKRDEFFEQLLREISSNYYDPERS